MLCFLVGQFEPTPVSHDCRDIKPQRFGRHDLDLLGSRDVIGLAIYGLFIKYIVKFVNSNNC